MVGVFCHVMMLGHSELSLLFRGAFGTRAYYTRIFSERGNRFYRPVVRFYELYLVMNAYFYTQAKNFHDDAVVNNVRKHPVYSYYPTN